MKKEIKIENKRRIKRKISIITVFLGIFLLLTIGVISQKGLNKTNALEEPINSNNSNLEIKNINLENNEDDEDYEDVKFTSSVKGEVMYGEEIVYTITVKNIYEYDMENVTIEYPIQNGIEFISSEPETTLENWVLKWNIPIIKKNETITIIVNTRVSAYKSGGNLYAIICVYDGKEYYKEVLNDENFVKRPDEPRIQVTITPRQEYYDVYDTATWDIEITNNTRMEQEFIINDKLSNEKKVVLRYDNGKIIQNNRIITVPVGKTKLVSTYEIEKNDSENEITNTITLKNRYFDSYFSAEGTTRIRKLIIKKKILVSKIWEDNNNENGKRPDSVTLQIKNGDKIVDECVVNEKGKWRYVFKVEEYDEEGNEINYTVDEKDTSEYYEKIIEGYTVINKYIGEEEKEQENGKDKEDIENSASSNNIDKDIENVDTSDINVWLYVGIAIVSIIVIVIMLILVMKKRNKNK